MSEGPTYPKHPTADGYMTETTKLRFITKAVAAGDLPKDAHRMGEIVSLTAPTDPKKPIQFWQLFSLLGQRPIVAIVSDFYTRVFQDEDWFRSVFERVGDARHHTHTQASMWIDVMGGGPYYHGGDFRLNFHHTHNAHQLMHEKGAKRWVELMVQALDANDHLIAHDPRIRRSLNTFLNYFFGKYAEDFNFENREKFGEGNAPYLRKVNFMNMTQDAIEALSDEELTAGLAGRGVDTTALKDRDALLKKALAM